MISVKRLGLFSSVLLLALGSGCSSSEFRDRNSDYHKAEAASYTLPENLAQRDAMPIPEASGHRISSAQQAPRPEPLRVLDEKEGVVQQRADEQGGWLLVTRSPSEVWTSLQAFAQSQDVAVTSSNPRQGQILLAADTASRLPAQRISLRQGVRRGTSEVRLHSIEDQQLLPFSDYDRTRMMSMEAFLVTSLTEGGQSVSLQAQSLHSNHSIRLVDRDGREVLVMQLEYDRAWTELVHLLEDEFNDDYQRLDDLNRSEGRFYVRYVPQNQRPSGFWSRLFSRAPAADAHNYQLFLSEYHQELDLILETAQGVAAPEAVETELLSWLERQLR
ncbi:MAG: outer membrane protein assembly factor BamC [Marinospirillum sp.]|uniref:outer membrane protein assembly factor BamC n=1 Tax=Marinospirillum sp. TaxID=2183934 RepID=UPI001A06C8D4|nr:outer membrane protein assembly factor BamC [Marinospirillum sp.]MBE0506491.1 outer membrane protein assembly factor BamC [Marinospirillum sp.]